tara:strand:- start:265 stop:546 length:282 start_codon:yes stop_codon:yes gene_type:complete
MTKSEKIQQLITDLYWEFDRMSSSGQETLEELATLVGVPTEAEMDEENLKKSLLAMGVPKESLHLYMDESSIASKNRNKAVKVEIRKEINNVI